MKIQIKTTTYGRIGLLEECLYSFINQEDIGDTLMIIVNDYPLQTLVFDHPNVRIYNLKETFKTIGEKDNFAIELGNGDIIATCDDDDIYMPNHLNNIRKYFKEDTNILHWKGVFYNEPKIDAITGIGNSGMVYSRKAWLDVGKHPIMNAGGDSVFSATVHDKLKGIVEANVPDNEVSAWYRWKLSDNTGISVYHQSGMGTDTPNRANVIQRHAEHIEYWRSQGKIPTGVIELKPHWNQDYQKLLEDYCKQK